MFDSKKRRTHPRRGRRLGLALAVLLALPPAAGAFAAEIEGVHFADRVTLDGETLPLRGTGLLRYGIFIKAYVAAFYGRGPEALPGPPSDAPRRLEIEYFWALSADQFARATRAGMAQNLSPRELLALEPEIAQINALYEDVEPGDRYALTWREGRTELTKNGRTLGSVAGQAFARAMFAIWIGPQPLSPGLKSQLLGASSG